MNGRPHCVIRPVLIPTGILEGDGRACPRCGQGVLVAKEWTKDGAPRRALVCSRRPACMHTEEGGPIIPGHGSHCPACGDGILLTRHWARWGRRGMFLLCTDRACRHSQFAPDADDGDSPQAASSPGDGADDKPLHIRYLGDDA